MRGPALQAERGQEGSPEEEAACPEPTPLLPLGPPVPSLGRAVLLRTLEPVVWPRLLGWGRGWPKPGGHPSEAPSPPKLVLGPHTPWGARMNLRSHSQGIWGGRPHPVTGASRARRGLGNEEPERRGCSWEGAGRSRDVSLTSTRGDADGRGQTLQRAGRCPRPGNSWCGACPACEQGHWGQGAAGTARPCPAGPRGPLLRALKQALEAGRWGSDAPHANVSAIRFHNRPGFRPSRGRSIKTQYILIISLRATGSIVSRWGPC